MKKIVILGSTGSIGTSTLDVVRQCGDRFTVVGLAAGTSWEAVEKQAFEFSVKTVALFDETAAAQLRSRHPDWQVLSGPAGLVDIAVQTGADLVVAAIVGSVGAAPVLAALQAGIDVGLANKEALVMGGELVMAAAQKSGAKLLPIDSEHNALFQCLVGEKPSSVDRLILTASGGPFFGRTDDLTQITPEEALNHPRWSMGAKITIDSATLMNKGLEVIEAHHLFGFTPDRISVVVHPQSIIHSLVEFIDGSIKAQLGVTDMRFPIVYVMDYPERVPNQLPKLQLTDLEHLTFAQVDNEQFPALALARSVIKEGGTAPTIMNAANEVAVHAFLDQQLSFPGIVQTVKRVLEEVQAERVTDWETVLAADTSARKSASAIVRSGS